MGRLHDPPSGWALGNDTVFNCVQGAAFAAVFVIHTHSIVALIACWGLGSAAGALYGLRQHRVLPKFTRDADAA